MEEQHEEPGLDAAELRTKLNMETGRLSWSELQRHFARGVVVVVANDLDLIDVAARFAEDDKEKVRQWTERGKVRRATDEDARRWESTQRTFWATVTAPWVLVQETTA